MQPHHLRKTATVLTLVLALAVMAAPTVLAQKTMSDSAMATANATIQAIDSTNRLISLKFDDGSMDTMYAGPEVKRFNELKVGDKVSFRYHESLVLELKKTTAPPSAPTMEGAVTRGTGPKPSGTYSRQMKATVVVEAIDMALPSITVRTAAGAKVTYKVEDKKNLEGVAVGDHVEITYTQALVIAVEEPKK